MAIKSSYSPDMKFFVRLGTSFAESASVVISTLRLFPSREQRRSLQGFLRSIQGPTQAQPRCLHCRLYEEDGCEETVLYVEQWESEEDLQRHIRSDLYRRILEAMELSCRSPEVAFHSVSATAGMELIEALRGAAGAAAESREIRSE